MELQYAGLSGAAMHGEWERGTQGDREREAGREADRERGRGRGERTDLIKSVFVVEGRKG